MVEKSYTTYTDEGLRLKRCHPISRIFGSNPGESLLPRAPSGCFSDSGTAIWVAAAAGGVH